MLKFKGKEGDGKVMVGDSKRRFCCKLISLVRHFRTLKGSGSNP